MKRFFSVLLVLMMLPVWGASAAKSKATPTPAPMDITTEVVEPPLPIQRLLNIAWQDWQDAAGRPQIIKSQKNSKGKKVVINKYTQWYNQYFWNSNGWCAGFVTWCMIEAGLTKLDEEATEKKGEPVWVGWDEIKKWPEEVPEPIFSSADSTPSGLFSSYQHFGRITTVPQKGFIALYGNQSTKFVHVGIVYDVEPLGEGKFRLTTIEGAMGVDTVRMYVYDYDMNAKQVKNITAVPKEERDREESDMFQYTLKATSKKPWFITKFLMPWVPGDDFSQYEAEGEAESASGASAAETPEPED